MNFSKYYNNKDWIKLFGDSKSETLYIVYMRLHDIFTGKYDSGEIIFNTWQLTKADHIYILPFSRLLPVSLFDYIKLAYYLDKQVRDTFQVSILGKDYLHISLSKSENLLQISLFPTYKNEEEHVDFSNYFESFEWLKLYGSLDLDRHHFYRTLYELSEGKHDLLELIPEDMYEYPTTHWKTTKDGLASSLNGTTYHDPSIIKEILDTDETITKVFNVEVLDEKKYRMSRKYPPSSNLLDNSISFSQYYFLFNSHTLYEGNFIPNIDIIYTFLHHLTLKRYDSIELYKDRWKLVNGTNIKVCEFHKLASSDYFSSHDLLKVVFYQDKKLRDLFQIEIIDNEYYRITLLDNFQSSQYPLFLDWYDIDISDDAGFVEYVESLKWMNLYGPWHRYTHWFYRALSIAYLRRYEQVELLFGAVQNIDIFNVVYLSTDRLTLVERIFEKDKKVRQFFKLEIKPDKLVIELIEPF
jgi:hypothetical protein